MVIWKDPKERWAVNVGELALLGSRTEDRVWDEKGKTGDREE